ncbi:hypothetical protein [Demequina litorisediminis]|uniref:hypothetical protein n=1 Tax=Demequina litorisediminis TaxID=1849022 RepID=UPI0024E0B3D7|nr:hypothetical protein [Demequina litorisediminis]
MEREDAQAALGCAWDEGDDPRRLALGRRGRRRMPGGMGLGLPLIFVETYLSRDDEGPAIVVGWDIMNLTDEPLVIDDESIAVLLEVPPGERGATDPEVAGLTLAADDLWFTSSDRATVQSLRCARLHPGTGRKPSGRDEAYRVHWRHYGQFVADPGVGGRPVHRRAPGTRARRRRGTRPHP